MSTRGVTFNGSDLETVVPGLKITGLPDRPPTRNINALGLARMDKVSVASAFYAGRKISIVAEVARDSRILLDDQLDILNKYLAPKEKLLVVPYGSTTRQYTATFSNMSKKDNQGGYVSIELEFICSDSLGYDTASTTIATHNHNVAATKSYFFVLDGSAEWQYPVITVTVNSLLGGTSKDITLSNHSTGQGITVNRTWIAGDVLVIDTVNQTVKVNSADVAFTGAFPIFQLPSGTLDYTDTISNRDVNISAVYQRRYV